MKHKILNVLFTLALLLSFSLAAAAPASALTFTASELLGRPTDHSVTVNVVADEELEVYFEYGTTSGVYTGQTGTATFAANTPIEMVIDGLEADTQYYYRMRYRQGGTGEFSARDEHSFRTQRAPGSTFTFTITADSHLGQYGGKTADEKALYQQALLNAGADNPDFHIDLGDTFPMDPTPLGTGMTEAEAKAAYLTQRPFMGLISASTPIFLALGNHENEEGWNFDDTFAPPDASLALLGLKYRKLYYPNPVPDGSFYTGNTDNSLTVGDDYYREDYYAWTWGDALFVVLDPFQYTMIWPSEGNTYGGEGMDGEAQGDRWDWTLGKQQYDWLKQTLETSDAKYKFVFSHHVTGGATPYGRGGIAAAPYFEWGGKNWDGTWGFDTERPGWDMPIHQLMVDNGVNVFFHGHDHIFAMEELDGIVYLECPKPDDAGYAWEPYGYGYTEGLYPDGYLLQNSGHIRITVSPDEVTVDYVRAYLPGDGTNGEVAYTYTIMADPDNSPPVANNQAVGTAENTPVAITLTANDVDGDSLTYSIVTSPSHGSLSGTEPYLTYTPDSGYNGSDSFTFKANDGVADSNIATVSIAVNSTISVDDFANYRVFQRDIGGTSKSVPISGTYSNMDWNRVEARVVQHGTNTAVVGWTTIDTTPGGGTFSGNLIVPQGGWYNIETRALDGAGSVIDSSRGTNKWGVGMIILCIGQSNMSGNGQPPFTTVTSDFAVNYSNAGIWEHLSDPYDDESPTGAVDNDNSTAGGSMVPALANSLLQTFSFPIAFVPSAKGGSNLYSQWVYRNPSNHYDTATLYGQSITKAQSVGGVELIIMHQGEADTNDHRTEAQYEADFATMIGNYRQDLYATIPIFICQLGTIELGTNTRTDADVVAVRNAQHDLDNGVNIFMAATAMDQPRLDAVHYTCQGLNAIGGRIAQTIKYYLGATSYYRGPAITSAFFVGNRNTVEIQIVHRGGNDITPVSDITGFSLLSDGSPVGITSAERISVDRIRLTLASVIPQNAMVKLRYLWGSNPDTSAIVKDNSSLALPLENTTTEITVVEPVILGDANGDATANSTDALIVLSCDVGINTSQFCPMNCGDANGDGLINSTDALIILSYDVGITVPYPVGEPGCPSSVTQCPGCGP
jgi:hypothetical protein